jgi:hypothetical protein
VSKIAKKKKIFFFFFFFSKKTTRTMPRGPSLGARVDIAGDSPPTQRTITKKKTCKSEMSSCHAKKKKKTMTKKKKKKKKNRKGRTDGDFISCSFWRHYSIVSMNEKVSRT